MLPGGLIYYFSGNTQFYWIVTPLHVHRSLGAMGAVQSLLETFCVAACDLDCHCECDVSAGMFM